MMGDTSVKTVQNRQCIDNVSDYDSEHYRISKSVHHRLDLGPNMLLGAQQHTGSPNSVFGLLILAFQLFHPSFGTF